MVLERVLPKVPEFASRTIQGKIDLSVRVAVDPSGSVSDVTLETHGKSRYFSNLALEAARGWKFRPPLDGDQPIASNWTLRFQFRRDGVEVSPVEEP
jgi:TonB family protein